MYVQITTSVGNRADAERIAREAVAARQAACAQIVGPVGSVYRWRGAVETADEWLVVMKTSGAETDGLIDFIRSLHSYETPEIVATEIIAGHAPYLAWIDESVAASE